MINNYIKIALRNLLRFKAYSLINLLGLALGLTVIAYVLLNIVSVKKIYDSVEWPVIVLLGSLIPIGAALEASGGTGLIANWIVTVTQGLFVTFLTFTAAVVFTSLLILFFVMCFDNIT